MSIKMPKEALFIDWKDSVSFTYSSPDMKELGRNSPNADLQNWKGSLYMRECNLAHRMIAQGFSLSDTVGFLLE